jgi:pimeloyl-ACP methyl ester carboxylesterase
MRHAATRVAAMDPTAEWRQHGRYLDVGAYKVLVSDFAPARDVGATPMLVLHGFPTCSYDWRLVLPRFAQERRVVLFDFLGFGWSDKPDVRYGIDMHADVAERVVDALGIPTVVLVSHDMGDTVGGELLARDLDGVLPFSIERRLLTNGSIYIEMANLTAGQEMLLGLDDARVDLASFGIDPAEGFRGGLAGTFSAAHPAPLDELDAQWVMASHQNGHTLLARTIRYVEDRRAHQDRFTGAIEMHPSPLGVVWGALDPVAVRAMAARLAAERPQTAVCMLDDVGHYPMIEAPGAFADACLELLAKDS